MYKNIKTYKANNHFLLCLTLSPDEKIFITSGSLDKFILILSVNGGKVIKAITIHDYWISTLSISNNTNQLVSGSYYTTLILSNIITD